MMSGAMADRAEQRLLAGRAAFVAGGASGIGRVIALRLAAGGADVVITSRDTDRMDATLTELRSHGVTAHGVELDLADLSSPDRAFEQAVGLVGPIDVVVANSGIGGPTAPLWEVEVEDLEETLDVNVRGTFLVLRAATRHMVPRERGSIVVIGSMTGKRPLLNRTPYAASKMALVGLVRTLAAEAGPHGIRVNLVSPGFVSGPRLDWVVAGQASSRGITEDEVRAEMTADTPLRRFTAPEDVADTVVHLAGDRSAGITGADINVSAGLVMY
jgi:NAD(P)-dependent dehydrogenase (short-subunit alcohol dehydrogenase family)